MNKELIRESIRVQVRQGISEAVTGKSENSQQLTESQINEIQETVLEEGLGSGIFKAIATAGGGVIGGKFGGVLGAALGGAIGLIAPSIAIPALATGAVAGGVYGLYKGGSAGLRLARNNTTRDSEKLMAKLIENTNKRDEMIQQAAEATKTGNGNKEQISNKIDKLTQEQQTIGGKLLKELQWDHKKGFMDLKSYNVAKTIAETAKKGKLTYKDVS